MRDGVYQVETHYFVAGFVISGGRVTRCAPILRKNLPYWKTKAKIVAKRGCGELNLQ